MLFAARSICSIQSRFSVGGRFPLKLKMQRATGVSERVRIRLLTTQVMPRKTEKQNNVDVQVDDGPWQRATLEPSRGQYAWRLWSLTVKNLPPGPHKVHSRATDTAGSAQPTAADRRKSIASGREDFSIWTREITV